MRMVWRGAGRLSMAGAMLMVGGLMGAGPATGPADRFEALIGQLSSDSWQARQQAQEALVELGPDIRPRLAQLVRETSDEEVRTRAEAALRRLEDIASTGPSIITLHLKNATPQMVFAELSKQAGADLRPSPPELWESRPWPRIDVEIDHQPFWLAMREICQKLGVGIQSSGLSREMVIAERNAGMRIWGQAPTVLSGPFLITASYINTHRSMDLNQPQNVSRNCNIQMQVYAEPKLRVLQGSYVATIERAVDENGRSLEGVKRVISQTMQPASNWFWNLSISLMPPADAGTRIASLKGSAQYVIQTRAEAAEIADVLRAKNVTRAVGGKRFLLKEVRGAGESYIVQLTIYRAGWSANEWMLTYPYSIFRLVDAAGTPLLRTSNAGGGGGGATEMNVNLTFQRPAGSNIGEPAKLIWEVPVESKLVVVPFEFKDLPLP